MKQDATSCGEICPPRGLGWKIEKAQLQSRFPCAVRICETVQRFRSQQTEALQAFARTGTSRFPHFRESSEYLQSMHIHVSVHLAPGIFWATVHNHAAALSFLLHSVLGSASKRSPEASLQQLFGFLQRPNFEGTER